MARYGIVVDVARCTGCMTCMVACKEENRTRPGIWWNKVFQIENDVSGSIVYIRHACMHCDLPPCMDACSQKAIYKRPDGIVLIDETKCRGDGDCVLACPYDAIEINSDQVYFSEWGVSDEDVSLINRIHPPGKASKCNFCVHRIDKGKEPACVESCPSTAMTFGDLDDPDSPVQQKRRQPVPLLNHQKFRPNVSYMMPEPIDPISR